MSGFAWTSFPTLLTAVWLAAELAAVAVRRFRAQPAEPNGWRFALWTLRPWACWAVVNNVFRWRVQDAFNTPATFPFYADLWDGDVAVWPRLGTLFTEGTFWFWLSVSLLLAAGMAALAYSSSEERASSRAKTLLFLAAVFVPASCLSLAVGCLPRGATPPDLSSSLLAPWYNGGATMLFDTLNIGGSGDYLRNFVETMSSLKMHARSHPPGASLSLHWIGQIMEVCGKPGMYAFPIGLALASACSVFLVYGLGRAIFGESTGRLAAVLWAVMPATVTYSTFAQDMVYAIFFNSALLLTWFAATSDRFRLPHGLLLGASFFALSMLTYSWCIMTSIFTVFVWCWGWMQRRPVRQTLLRWLVPLLVFGILLLFTVRRFHLDYLAMYRNASEFVASFYRFGNFYQKSMALVGGQIGFLVMWGSIVCSAFVAYAWRLSRADARRPENIFLLVPLVLYAVPVLFGPYALRMEVARCWIWVATLPVIAAARHLQRMPHPRTWAAGAVLVSGLTAVVMRVFIAFWG